MKTVTFEVSPPKQAMTDLARDWEADIPDTSAKMIFASEVLLAQVMTESRWDILKTLCGVGGIRVDELAARLNRDVEGVEADVAALLNAGVLDGDQQQHVIFPYDQILLDLPTTGRSTV
jgi:predicted transcriptional regulator